MPLRWRDRIRSAKPEIITALGGNDDPAGETLHNLGVHALLVTDAERARLEVAELVACGSSIGLDIETMPNAEEAAAAEACIAAIWHGRPARHAATGAVAASDPAPRLRAELGDAVAGAAPPRPGQDPARPGLCRRQDRCRVRPQRNRPGHPGAAVEIAARHPQRRIRAEIPAGGRHRTRALRLHDADGRTGWQASTCRSLDDASREFLNINLTKKKELQTSDWSAPNLSRPQLNYAALDAVLAFRLAEGPVATARGRAGH